MSLEDITEYLDFSTTISLKDVKKIAKLGSFKAYM